jgi:hypothetical protein
MKKRQTRGSLNTRREATRHRKQMKDKQHDKAERGERHARRQDKNVKEKRKKKAIRRNPLLAQFWSIIFGGKHAK